VDFQDRITNQMFITVDNDDNIIGTFYGKNEILKFSKNGRQLFQTDRPLNYSIPDNPVMRSFTTPSGNSVEMLVPTFVSFGIRIDSKSRIWVTTMRKQFDIGNMASIDLATAQWDLHVLDSEGILLTKFSIDRSFFHFRIFGDRLFLIDTENTMSVYEYKIVEK